MASGAPPPYAPYDPSKTGYPPPSAPYGPQNPGYPPPGTGYPPGGYPPAGAPPPPGFQTPYPSGPMAAPPQQQQQQSVIVVGAQAVATGNCPVCRNGNIVEDYTCCGICLAIFFFPLGLICCLLMRERRCTRCGARI